MTTTVLTSPAPAAPERRSWLWPNLLYGLIGMNLVVVGVTVYAANRDPSFAVEPNYDTKALEWNKVAAQIASNQKLGWTLDVDRWPATRTSEPITIRLSDSVGRPPEGATVELTAFASIRASARLSVTLTPAGPGVYSAVLPVQRSGLWEFRFKVDRGPDTFTRSFEKEIAGS